MPADTLKDDVSVIPHEKNCLKQPSANGFLQPQRTGFSSHSRSLSPNAFRRISKQGTFARSHSDPVAETAKKLALDFIKYKTEDSPQSPPSDIAETLRRTADELLRRHEFLFNGIVEKLDCDDDKSFPDSFNCVANETFADGDMNWGRIVALYAFAGRLAIHHKSQGSEYMVDQIAEWLGEYIASSEKLITWMKTHNEWEGFAKFFPDRKENQLEKKMWNGLLCTLAVLGTGAVVSKFF